MKERGVFRNVSAAIEAGTSMNLLNLMRMKRKVRFRSGHATPIAGKSDNHLTFFCNAL